MNTSFIQQARVPLLAAAFAFVLGAEVQCPGAGEAQRISLASLQADIDELAIAHTSERMQLVGFTSDKYLGDEGVPGFTEACQVEFAESRMCTSVEVMRTTELPILAEATTAWVRPVFAPMAGGTGLQTQFRSVTDASGSSGNPGTRSCSGWRTADGGTGLSIDDRGRFSVRSCSEEFLVACCAMVP